MEFLSPGQFYFRENKSTEFLESLTLLPIGSIPWQKHLEKKKKKYACCEKSLTSLVGGDEYINKV